MLFNRELLIHHRQRLLNNIDDFKFFFYALDDIIERLQFIDKKFVDILNIGCGDGKLTYSLSILYNTAQITSTDISNKSLESLVSTSKIVMDEERLELNHKFELITYCLGLQWINDIEAFFQRINAHLLPEGIFIGNFIGGNSFKNLRSKLIEVEEKTIKKHSTHLPPFIMFEHVSHLLNRAGFKEIIVDQEKISLEYKSPIALMRELNKFGESSKLSIRPNYSITKNMHALLSKEDMLFTDEIYLISFVASKNKGTLKIK